MSMMDRDAVAAALPATVPLVKTLGISVIDVVAEADGSVRAVVELPDSPALHNHVGGPHAGALFSVGETATGALMVAAFSDQTHKGTPLAVRAEITYLKLARGTVRATAVLRRSIADILTELDAGSRPEFPVEVEIATADGVVTAQMSVLWTIRPHRT